MSLHSIFNYYINRKSCKRKWVGTTVYLVVYCVHSMLFSLLFVRDLVNVGNYVTVARWQDLIAQPLDHEISSLLAGQL